MACRWRIRHKLMLGFGLVIVLIALLLLGTFYGLRSYRRTTHHFDRKTAELTLANSLRAAVKDITKSGHVNLEKEFKQIKEKLHDARMKFGTYKKHFRESVNQGFAIDNGYKEQLQTEGLKEQLDKLDAAISAAYNTPRSSDGSTEPIRKNKKVISALDDAVRAADDLIGVINSALAKRKEQAKDDYRYSFIFVLCISIGGMLLLAGLFRRFYVWLYHPLHDLQLGVARITEGDFKHRIEVTSGDEIEELAARFNHMTGELDRLYSDLHHQVNERSRQLVRSERLASVGFLAAGVAHEINNPLASIAFCSEALESRLDDAMPEPDSAAIPIHRAVVSQENQETIRKYLKMIQDEAFRCKEITEKLLAFSRGGEGSRERTDLNEIVQSVFDVVQHLQNGRDKNLVFQPEAPLFVWVNSQEIKSVVLNLVVNALESMEEGGTLTISHRVVDGMAEIGFSDTGCGMSAEVLDNIFEPFYTTKEVGKGTGLGLSISHRIINQHGGEIEAFSPGINRGSTFVVRLPLKPPEDTTADDKQQSSPEEEFRRLRAA